MTTAGPARIVLDTNAVLDWLLFDGSAAAGLKRALVEGRVLPLVDGACLAEFDAVLRYPRLKVTEVRATELSAVYRTHAEWFEAQPGRTESPGSADAAQPRIPRCRDRDDQKFLALAVAARVEFVVSRDIELLRVDRRMRRDFGIAVLTPASVAVHPRVTGAG